MPWAARSGARCATGGAEVVTTLAGRSERTARLAREAGIECMADLDTVVEAADVVLSIGPPGEAEAIAQSIARRPPTARRGPSSPT